MTSPKAERTYDPFPKSGLVAQYRPFIERYVRDYCAAYPAADYTTVLIEALNLAQGAANRFDPALGNSFVSFLAPYLKGINKLTPRKPAGLPLTIAGLLRRPRFRPS